MRKRTLGGITFGVVVAASCRAPTEITLKITTNESCDLFRGAAITTGPDGPQTESRFSGGYPVATTTACAAGTVGTLVLTPGSGSGGAVIVAAAIATPAQPNPDPTKCGDPANASSCIIARRVFSFIDHDQLDLPIDLDLQCLGRSCDPGSTCFKGTCVSDNVTCTDGACGLPIEGSGSGSDGGAADGSYDQDSGLASDSSVSDSGTIVDASDGGGGCTNVFESAAAIWIGTCHGPSGMSCSCECYDMSGNDHGSTSCDPFGLMDPSCSGSCH